MRTWGVSVLLALALVACGGKTSDTDQQPDPADTNGSSGGTVASDGSGGSQSTGGSSGSGGSIPEPYCIDGTTGDAGDLCGTCTCVNGGWLCTNDACSDPNVCQPGDVVENDGCVTCICSYPGFWECNQPCPDACEAGTVKSAGDGCNTCECGIGGTWACTLGECPEPLCPIPDDLPEQDCTGSEHFGRAEGTDACCAICYSLEGYRYYDSLEACEASKSCEPGETKYADDECNTCTCSNDGTWACTDTDCEPVYCGGLAGGSCAEDEYCAYEAGWAGCGFNDANAICRPRPTTCTKEEAPVCACNHETFAGECLANMAGWGVMSNGACAE